MGCLCAAMCAVKMLPAPPWCRAESTEQVCRPAADDVAVGADRRSQHREYTHPQYVRTDCGNTRTVNHLFISM